VALACAVGLWLFSVGEVDLSAMDGRGLVGVLPVTWFMALAYVVVGLAFALTAQQASRPLLTAHVAVLVLVLYGTAPATSDTPRYYWAYKHIGVAQWIGERGAIDPELDIYHRWPGFLAASAAMADAAGIDVVDLARVAELAFALLNAALVVGLGQVLTGQLRTAYLAGALFTSANWVGQGYFAPQAAAFSLALAVTLLLLVHMQASPNRLGLAVERVSRWGLRAPAPGGEPARSGVPSAPVLAVAAVLFTALVVSHQLTPFIVLIGLGLAAALGLLRPAWFVGLLVVLAVLHLVPNLSYVLGAHGLFSSLNPVENSLLTYSDEPVLPAKVLRATATNALVVLVWGAGLVAVLVAARRALRRGLLLALLMVGPTLVVAVQSYGGEARLRVFLFTLPWCAIAIAWAWQPVLASRRRLSAGLLTGELLAAVLLLFLPAFYGDEDINHISRAELRASQWLFGEAREGAVVVLSAPGFPVAAGAGYAAFADSALDNDPNLARAELDLALPPAPLGRQVAERVQDLGRGRGFLVFSTNQAEYARAHGLFGDGDLRRIEQAVRASGSFRAVYGNEDARIYVLDGRGRQ
jgi:hypothetical protein